jgi:ketosteroid isomerase-like protein
MSQHNLDLVVRAIRAAIARPKPDYETINELYSADHVLVPAGVETGLENEGRGAEAFREWRRHLDEFVANAEHELRGAVDIGSDKVLAVTTSRGEGRTSGAPAELRIWNVGNVVTVVGGKVVRTEAYSDSRKALEAAGLRE